jgi:hypothetical protein
MCYKYEENKKYVWTLNNKMRITEEISNGI